MGALTDKAVGVAGAFNNFATALTNATNKKKDSVGTADHAARLNGLLPTEIVDTISGQVNNHVENTEHGLTAAQVGAFTKAEMDDVIKAYPAISKMPFVSYGDATKVPIDVSGAFSGASDGATVDYTINLEDDGTVVILRNGTDGSKYRTYYAYVPDGAAGEPQRIIKTTKEFRPNNLPANLDVKYIYSGNNVLFFAKLIGKTAVASDNSGPVVAFLPAGSFVTDTIPYVVIDASIRDTFTWLRAGTVCGEYVYFLDQPAGTTFRLWRIPTAHFDGRTVIPEQVTNWSVTTPRRQSVQDSAIKLFDEIIATNPAVDAIVYVDITRGDSMTALSIYHNAPEVSMASKDGRYIRFRMGAHTYLASRSGKSVSIYMSFSVVLDLINKTAIMDPGPTGPAVITSNHDGNHGFITSTDGYWKYSKGSILGNFIGNSPRDVAIQQRPGYQHAIICNGEFDSWRSYIRGKFLGSVDSTAFECLKYGVTIQVETGLGLDPSYGSATGSMFYGVIPYGDNKMFLAASGRDKNGYTDRSLARVVNDINVPAYQYKTLHGQVYTGYGPTTDRKFIKDYMPYETMKLYAHLVTEVDDDTGYTVHGSYFTSLGYVFGVGDIDSNGNEVQPGKRVFIKPSIYEDILNGMATANNIPRGDITRHVVGVFFPKCLPRGYAYVQWMVDATKRAYIAMVELTISTGTLDTTVTGITINQVSAPFFLADGNANAVSWWYPEHCGGVTIYKVGTEGYVIGFTTKGYVGVVGGAGSQMIQFFVNNYSDKPPQVKDAWSGDSWVQGWVYPYLASNIGYAAFKGLGYGYYSNIDNMTKLLFTPYGKTKAEIMTNKVSTTHSPVVIATQELAQGWDVYFTNPMTVLMGGTLVNVPATSINLKTIQADPSNKTFYIYLKWVAGVVSYDIVATKVRNRHDYVQIGTVTTGPSSITNIEVNKLNLFGANSEH